VIDHENVVRPLRGHKFQADSSQCILEKLEILDYNGRCVRFNRDSGIGGKLQFEVEPPARSCLIDE